jgi:hypothetical protein
MINDPSGKKVWTTDSMDQYEKVVAELAYIGLPPPSPHLDADRLFKVVEPWGQVGFDVLRRILVASRRTREPFPFFMYELNAETDTPIPVPNSPSKETVDFIIGANTRIGRSTTGKGELLLALLTGGIAGSPVGDLEIAGQYFELKDVRTGAIRAGDVTSVKFEAILKDWFKTKWQHAPDFNNNYEAFLPTLKTGESYASFLAAYPEAEDEINALAQEALEEEKMKYVLLRDSDFIFMEPKMFKFVSFPRRLNVIASNDALPGTTSRKRSAKARKKSAKSSEE